MNQKNDPCGGESKPEDAELIAYIKHLCKVMKDETTLGAIEEDPRSKGLDCTPWGISS